MQLVRPQTRPCQSADTASERVEPTLSSNPPVSGPTPDWVRNAGHIVSGHWLVTVMVLELPSIPGADEGEDVLADDEEDADRDDVKCVENVRVSEELDDD